MKKQVGYTLVLALGKEKVRTRHARTLAHRTNDARNLEDMADPPLVRAFDDIFISLHDHIRDGRELLRALAVMDESSEHAPEEGKRVVQRIGAGVEVVLHQRPDQARRDRVQGLRDGLGYA